MSQDTSERGYGLKVSLYGMNPVCRKEHGEMVKFHTYENGQQRTCVTPASVANGVAQAFSSINGLDPDIIPCQIMAPAELAIFSYGFKVPEELSVEVVNTLEKYKESLGDNFDFKTKAYIEKCGKKPTPEPAGVGESKPDPDPGSNGDEDEDDNREAEGGPVASDEQVSDYAPSEPASERQFPEYSIFETPTYTGDGYLLPGSLANGASAINMNLSLEIRRLVKPMNYHN